ncbi:Abi-alpha family protein [Modestobacter sp. VKM Ac-2977]|uniref:Abi-alpha family protein n=1 Tax=Modestobacter sp. VKM Ac-2977 TaxID=3004131 RepID=UPI003FA5C4B0
MPAYIDNWTRLGLVTVSYMEFMTAPDVYAWVNSRPEMLKLRQVHETEDVQVTSENGIIAPTTFGKAFAATVAP